MPNPPFPIYCRDSGTLREIILCITRSLLGMFKHLRGLDKYQEPVELERRIDVEDENILNLRNIAYRYLKSGDFCVILDHLENVTPRIHSWVSALHGCSSCITASRPAWDLGDFSSFSGNLALWHAPKLKVENLGKDDGEEDAVRLLKEIHRVAAIGYIVKDLRRSWVAWSLITVLTKIFTRNRLTRHDGPLSVLRSYTVYEHDALAGRAGFVGRRVVKEPFWLLVISGRKG
jgi:hypothetical protein